MSETAKKARAAMKAKAQRLGSDRPTEKVDSSTWTPAELLNADVKTGMRPVSRRAFKKGGKVMGECAPARADRAPRKSGGKAITADSLINRDQKEANESREGKKHIGGMKKGGRAEKLSGGALARYAKKASRQGDMAARMSRSGEQKDMSDIANKRQAGVQMALRKMQDKFGSYEDNGSSMMKKGGRAYKEGGGAMDNSPISPVLSGAQNMIDRSKAVTGAPSATLTFGPRGSSRLSRAAGLKKGGKAESHPDEAADKALIKKMVKPSARTGKDTGGGMDAADGDDGMKKGGRAKRATGGGIFSGPGYPGKVPGVVPGGRTARASGGSAKRKGKTAINIIINAGKQPGQDMDGMPPMPPGAQPKPPGAMPIAVPPAGAGMPPGGMPMPMPPPGLAGAGGPPGGMPPMPPGGMPPMPRKRGGRTVAKSYKDMTAGAGSGEGRLEKTEIAEHKRGERKAGGRTYRSYKDMDAGAGSGLGRLEKTEIQAHK